MSYNLPKILGSANISVNGAVAAATGWTTLRVNVNADASTVTYYVNGTSIGSSSSNIPTTTLTPYLQITKTLGGTARVVNADLFYLSQTLTNSR